MAKTPTLVDSALLEPVQVSTLPGVLVFPNSLVRYGNRIGEVKIDFEFGNNAQQLFQGYDSYIKAEPVEGRIHRLRQNTIDRVILEELGGEQAISISTANLFAMIAAQSKGEKGVLKVDGSHSIAYLEEFPGWAIRFGFSHGYSAADHDKWCLYADRATSTNLHKDSLLISR